MKKLKQLKGRSEVADDFIFRNSTRLNFIGGNEVCHEDFEEVRQRARRAGAAVRYTPRIVPGWSFGRRHIPGDQGDRPRRGLGGYQLG